MANYEKHQHWDWKDMMTFFKNMFGDPHQSERARDKLFSIKQGKKNIRTFVMEFNELLLLSSSSLDEDTKITMFRRSLDIKLQDKLIGTKYTKLDDLTSATIDIADQLYRMKLNSREVEEKSSVSKPTKPKQSLSSPPTLSDPKDNQMEGVEYTGRSNSSIIDKLKKEGRCFKCHKTGHLFANCQSVAVSKATAKDSKKSKKEKQPLSSEEDSEDSGKE